MARNEAKQKESDASRSQNANDEREQARQRFGVQNNTSRSNRKHRCKGPKVSAGNKRKAVWLECDEL